MYGKHHTEETRRKLSEINKGKNSGEKNPMYGKHLLEDTKEKIRQARLNTHMSEEAKAKISLWGQTHKQKGSRSVRCINT